MKRIIAAFLLLLTVVIIASSCYGPKHKTKLNHNRSHHSRHLRWG